MYSKQLMHFLISVSYGTAVVCKPLFRERNGFCTQ